MKQDANTRAAMTRILSAKTRAAMKRITEQFTVWEHLDMLKETLGKLGCYEPEGEERKESRRFFRDALHAAQYEVFMIRKLLKAQATRKS